MMTMLNTGFRRLAAVLLGFALVAGGSGLEAASRGAAERERLTEEVKSTIDLFKRTDETIGELFETSAGYAVFPRVSKGAVGLGAARGRGQVFDKGGLVGETTLTQVTLGLQLGGQVYAQVIFFENAEILRDFKDGNLEFSAQVSAVAAAEGVARNAKYRLGVLVFTLARAGLMYEASVGGQKFGYLAYED
jgi:lipid-binding SYLF domain-containing protein